MKWPKWMVWFLILALPLVSSGCFHANKKTGDDDLNALSIRDLPAGPEDAQILVTYLDNVSIDPTYQNILPRLKLVTPQEFDAPANAGKFSFVGRTYGNNAPFRRGLDLPIHEYYVGAGSPWTARDGFRYIFGVKCFPISNYNPDDPYSCPIDATAYNDPVAYSAAGENPGAGIVTLYQFETLGSVGYTTDAQIIWGLLTMQPVIPFRYKAIGYIYHSSQSDRDKRIK
ncbi:MAG: hypothetical protein HYY61_00050 [Deltaproteobacteria bacterium]|nr:hypothetical protein [Deltaproteobacteria bacterium]